MDKLNDSRQGVSLVLSAALLACSFGCAAGPSQNNAATSASPAPPQAATSPAVAGEELTLDGTETVLQMFGNKVAGLNVVSG